MKTTTNIGTCGPNSIRVGGMKIQDLPMAELASAVSQIPIVEDTDRQNKVNDVVAGAPKQRVPYLKSRVVECEANIVRIGGMKQQQQQMISEYTAQIGLCKFRDKEIERLDEDDPEYKTLVKDLFKRFPPYKVSAMEQQIVQSTEAMERADDVVAQEYTSIAELREYLVLCESRDIKLRALGVEIKVG